MLNRIFSLGLRAVLVGLVAWAVWQVLQSARRQPLPWRWRMLGWRHRAMATALRERKQISEVLNGSQLPVASSVLTDVDALVGSIADLVEVRASLGLEQARTSDDSPQRAQLATALGRTDESLTEALQRLDAIRAVLLDHAADRLQDALLDARERFAEHSEQLQRVADANREVREELANLKRQR